MWPFKKKQPRERSKTLMEERDDSMREAQAAQQTAITDVRESMDVVKGAVNEIAHEVDELKEIRARWMLKKKRKSNPGNPASPA